MEWLSGLLAFLKSLPELIKIFKEIWSVIADAQNAAEKKKRGQQLGEAIAKAKNEKDTSGLDEFFGVRHVPDAIDGSEQMQKPPSGT